MRRELLVFSLALLLTFAGDLPAEVCTTQSQMRPAERDAIVSTARDLAARVQANDAAGLRTLIVPEYAKDFSAMTSLVVNTSAKVKGAPLSVDQVYLLDASSLKTAPDGSNPEAQFYCSLNKSPAEANFLIPALPPGRYAFAEVEAADVKTPWRMSFLLRQNAIAEGTTPSSGQLSGKWSMAGFYPKPLNAAGHDGLWYWRQARERKDKKQIWTAYLYYREAETLLQPAGFLTSTHLDKLRKEETAAAPPSLSTGISLDTPLVVKGPDGLEYRYTELATDDSLGADKIDIVVHLQAEPAAEISAPSGATQKAKPAASAQPSPRDRNNGAMKALLSAYPELRENFHGIWVFADLPGKNPFVSELAMADVH